MLDRRNECFQILFDPAERDCPEPVLTPEQAREAELARVIFEPLPPDPEADAGDDPDYDL